MAPHMALNLREIEVYKPYVNELPEQMLADAGADEAQVQAWLQAPILRVAKLGDKLLGAYALYPEESREHGDAEHRQQHRPLTYRLQGIVVAPSHRKQGLGRWLTGHAIGVAESKGGRRVVLTPFGRGHFTRMFTHMGFVRGDANGGDKGPLYFDLIPE